ncbi:unnamed protein product [Rotaria magnacalcarata]|uniref:Mono(ADP-ribosyl)transferase n=1 Tax=Rotaria magnacalcarata TaxID=392030 RepID=A0A816ZGE3_9BILA|nr:unnamed protein product [Rotaria magnacalcarata]CAF3801132.1 unnamed protein product [Rotaria magnacalcarata]
MDNKKQITAVNVSNAGKSKQLYPANKGKPTMKQALATGVTSSSHNITTKVLNSSKDSFLIQDCILFWLDTNINLDDDCNINILKQFQSIVGNIHVFNNTDQCVDFLKKSQNQNVSLIVSGSVGQQIISRIHSIPQLIAIFIFCQDQPKYESLKINWSKVQGIFTDSATLCNSIKQLVHQFEEDSVDISFVSENDISGQDLDQLDQSFMYTQLIKEILLELEYDEQSFHNFLTYCRQEYSNNVEELKNIQDFERRYTSETSIWWYTLECFIYKILNKALHEQQTDVIISMGFFIRSLDEHIRQLQVQQAKELENEFIVYRGESMKPEQFEKLKKTEGGLIAFSKVLSTSKEKAVAIEFAEKALYDQRSFSILFIIKVDISISSTPFAAIQQCSKFEHEKEILFSMPTVFRINDIKPSDFNNRIWYVHLSSTSDNDKQLHQLTERMREEIKGPSALHRLGALMIKLSKFVKAEEVYKILLNRSSDELEKGYMYYQLGHIKDNQQKYDEAHDFYRKALTILLKHLSADHPNIASCYNNIGLVYDNMNEFSKALSFYEKAYAIYEKASPGNQKNLANCCSSIGLIYNSMDNYSKAFSFCKKAHDIFNEELPANHPLLATSHNNIGLVYANMKKYSEAFASYKRAVDIGQKVLPPDHPNLEVYKRNLESVRKKNNK